VRLRGIPIYDHPITIVAFLPTLKQFEQQLQTPSWNRSGRTKKTKIHREDRIPHLPLIPNPQIRKSNYSTLSGKRLQNGFEPEYYKSSRKRKGGLSRVFSYHIHNKFAQDLALKNGIVFPDVGIVCGLESLSKKSQHLYPVTREVKLSCSCNFSVDEAMEMAETC
jgi:hypothetical protein